MLLKIRNRIINTEAIAHVDLQARPRPFDGDTRHGVRITMLFSSASLLGNGPSVEAAETFFFEGEDAEAMRWYFGQAESQVDLITLYSTNLGSINQKSP